MSAPQHDPLKQFFMSRPSGLDGKPCPAEALLFEWSRGEVSDEERENLVRHASTCPACADKIAALSALAARECAEGPEDAALTGRIRAEVRRLRRRRTGPTDAGRRIWFAAFAVFMALSFVWPDYFMQMLVLAVVCAAKWLIDTRARHIYVDVLHRKDGNRGEGSERGRGRLFSDSSAPDERRSLD